MASIAGGAQEADPTSPSVLPVSPAPLRADQFGSLPARQRLSTEWTGTASPYLFEGARARLQAAAAERGGRNPTLEPSASNG